MPKVYLAGPITDLSYDDARKGWRLEAWDKFAKLGVDAASPMRGKDCLKDAKSLHRQTADYEKQTITSPQGITGRDRNDVKTCDVMLANFLGAKQASIGTAIEFGWADAWRIPIVLVMEDEGNPHDHLMITTMATYRVNNLDDGIKLVNLLVKGGW